jgi:hypothetical protein
MRILRLVGMVFLLCCFSAIGAWAQCPDAIGQWTTNDGSMIGGRATEAWCGADGNPISGGQPGNTQNAMSWDGVSLGTQWRAWGMSIDANGAILLSDLVDPVTGDGIRTYSTNYENGQFWLSKDNSWSDGVADLTGNLTSFNVVTTLTIRSGAVVAATSNITFTGEFVNCPGANGCVIRFGITNAMLIWNPAFGGAMPAGYPGLACAANLGEAFDVCCITVDIYCAVDTEDRAWGSVKALYK